MSATIPSSRVIDLARRLSKVLKTLTTPLSSSLGIDLDQCIEQASNIQLQRERVNDAIDSAIDLWNSSIDAHDGGAHSEQLLCLLKALASLLLHAAYCISDHSSEKESIPWVYLHSCLTTTARENLYHGRIAVAEQLIEKVADLRSFVSSFDSCSGDQSSTYEYYVLRIHLAWQQNRLDLAETWYGRSQAISQELTSENKELMRDLCLDIAENCRDSDNTVDSLKWFQKAVDQDSSDCAKLLFVRAILQFKCHFEYEKTLTSIFAYFDNQSTTHVTVKMLQTQWVFLKYPTDDLCLAVLIDTINGVETEDHYNFVVAYIGELKESAPGKAFEAARSLLQVVARMADAQMYEETVRLAVRIVAYSTVEPKLPSLLLQMLHGLDEMAVTMRSIAPLSQENAQACQALIWKQIEDVKPGDFRALYIWCQCGKAEILRESGEQILSKLTERYFVALVWESEQLDGVADNGFSTRLIQYLKETGLLGSVDMHDFYAGRRSQMSEKEEMLLISTLWNRGMDGFVEDSSGNHLDWIDMAFRLIKRSSNPRSNDQRLWMERIMMTWREQDNVSEE